MTPQPIFRDDPEVREINLLVRVGDEINLFCEEGHAVIKVDFPPGEYTIDQRIGNILFIIYVGVS